jgi:hypothetical protein
MHSLSYQPTLPADDVIWSKPSHPVSGPIPIPPRNEPPLSISTVEIPHSMGPSLASDTNCTYGGKCEDNTSTPLASDLLTTIKIFNQCSFQGEIAATSSPFDPALKRGDPLVEENMSTGYSNLNPLGDQSGSPVELPVLGTGRYLLHRANSSASISTVSRSCFYRD